MSMKDQLAKLGMIDQAEENATTPAAWERADRSNAQGAPNRGAAEGGASGRGASGRGASGRGAAGRGAAGRGSADRGPSGRGQGQDRARGQGARRGPHIPAPLNLTPEEREARIKSLFKRDRLALPPAGSQRFYFELRGGVVDFIETDQRSHDALSSGQVVIVSNEKGRPVGLNRQAAQELMSIDPDWIPRRL